MCVVGVSVRAVAEWLEANHKGLVPGAWAVEDSQGVVVVRFRGVGSAQRDAVRVAEEGLRRRYGALFYGDDPAGLPGVLVGQLAGGSLTMATAESCTGGMVGELITGVEGASGVYQGGWITYSNRMKTERLGVSVGLLDEHGAVSSPVAQAMAVGALERSGADVAVSVTGIAGPGGGSADKPVGTVWFGLAMGDESGGVSVVSFLCRFDGGRERVRRVSALTAIQSVRLRLLGERVDVIRWVDVVHERVG